MFLDLGLTIARSRDPFQLAHPEFAFDAVIMEDRAGPVERQEGRPDLVASLPDGGGDLDQHHVAQHVEGARRFLRVVPVKQVDIGARFAGPRHKVVGSVSLIDREDDAVFYGLDLEVCSQPSGSQQRASLGFGLCEGDPDARSLHHEGARPAGSISPPGQIAGRGGQAVALWLIGLGLHDATDITVKGLRQVRACDKVYAEFYTAILGGTDHDALQAFLQQDVEVLPREGVEAGGIDVVGEARDQDVAFLTAGDPLAATTHTEMIVRAKQAGIPVHIIHAPSIYSAAPGLVGLQHYKFGRTTTLVRPEENWVPTSPFEPIQQNHDAGLHTLVLLDIKAHEDYFMTANEGLELLLMLAQKTGADWFTHDTPAAVVARAGSLEGAVKTGTVGGLRAMDFGAPLHCIVIPGAMQVVEQEAWDVLAA